MRDRGGPGESGNVSESRIRLLVYNIASSGDGVVDVSVSSPVLLFTRREEDLVQEEIDVDVFYEINSEFDFFALRCEY